MQYQYKAKDKNGESIDGRMEGDTELSVRLRLRSQGMFPMVVVPLGRVQTTANRELNLFQSSNLLNPSKSSWLQFNSRVRRATTAVVANNSPACFAVTR